MDLRSIINADSSTAPPPAHPPPPSQFHPPQQQPQAPPPADYVRGNQGPYASPSSASYQGFQGKPAQPPPLQPPSQTDFRSPSGSSYHSAQSPYQHTPTSSLSGGQQYPFSQHAPPQSPVGQGQYPPSSIQRDSYSSVPISGQSHHYYHHPSQSPYPPSGTTPGSAHPPPQHQRSHSSYSTPTPTSAQAPAPYARHESPVLPGSHAFPQPQAQQHQHQHSQPSTPLGPPPPYTRTSSAGQREQHSPYSHRRNQSGGSYGAAPQNQPGSPTPQMPQGMTRTAVTPTGHTPTGHSLAQSPLSDQDRGGREYIAARERERSVSVSPKTMLPSQSRLDDAESKYIDHARLNRQVTPAKRKVEDAMFERNGRTIEQTVHSTSPDAMVLDRRDHGSPLSVGEISMNGRNGLHLTETHPVPPGSGISGWRDPGSGQAQEQLRPDAILPSPTTQTITKEPNQSDSRGPHASSGSSSTISQTQQPTTPQTASSRQTPNPQPSPKGLALQPPGSSLPPPPLPNLTSGNPPNRDAHIMSAAPGSASSPKQPQRKRGRYEEPPIFARKASRSTSSSPVMANRRQPAPVPAPTSGVTVKQEPKDCKRPVSSQPGSQPLDSSAIKREPPNGHPHPIANSNAHAPQSLEYGPQGLWEPTITNIIPYEEITRSIGHFLFLQVVQREDVGAGPAGGVPGQGAQLEIEAKIGQLIDRNTNERLRLPVMNECIISKDDPSIRINFKSSMTESQHKTLNIFLNKAVMDSQSSKSDHSQPAQKPRIPMTYVHTRERDSFYELPPHTQNTLPPSIRAQLNPRHRAKVRITTDQKSGKTLAKIIKARVADLDIYSPRTQFDWRISVNLEMGYEGEIEGLVEGGDGGGRADRNKDRMSYRHLAYQIDLTQVTPSDSTSKADKEHELEVEVSAAEIRKQGQLARDTGSSAYEDLVKGFIDNVRVLVRAAHGP
ncbi:MAG: mRNA-capping enzyme subunit beta [Geoglossum umbratile]|nr:MAG: mRNA-capping enzyme subunit beta [Geoglossum umbratile]